ncbi:MAG: protein translocase subunit SecF [Candidatus Zixiibacteriota bacterium]|nr:MAG: protein translocase subunit SecF [candidate division Zixibacteria bacterium]
MMHLVGKTNIDFIGVRKYAFIISGILTTLGLISLAFITFGQANMSIEFSGGTLIQGSFANIITINEIRSVLGGEGFSDATIQRIITQNNAAPPQFMIRVKTASSGSQTEQTMAAQLTSALDRALPGNKFTLDSVKEIGPTVGKELQAQARWAVAIALLGILIYIWIRFDFRFAVGATAATFHDVFAVLGFMFIMQREISLMVVTAILTLAGYSVTDTVVVFDRIRENLKLFRKKGDFVATVNGSINEVLSRTLITALTTFVSVLVILFLCGPVVRDFAMALAFGILIGTYSSIFVASPILVEWEARSPKRFK